MANITPELNDVLLKKHDLRLRPSSSRRDQSTDEFLKEAYRIEGHITSLYRYLRSIRQSYLSTSLPPRRLPLSRTSSSTSERVDFHHHSAKDRKYFTNAQRDQIDAESKSTLRDLNAGIRQLADAEQLRQNTESTIASRKRGRNGFKALGRWAAGGISEKEKKSPEEELEEAIQNTVKLHRESVIWYLRRKLEEAAEVQREMMQMRLDREIEKSKSVLYKTRGVAGLHMDDADSVGMNGRSKGSVVNGGYKGGKSKVPDEDDRKRIEQQLSPEQLQLFAQENSDMLKHYEDTLDQVRTAERSMVEISELQTALAQNLETQSAHIDQLVADSLYTTDNIGGGNKELKRATERKSTARMVFYASCGLSLFLIVWDLIF